MCECVRRAKRGKQLLDELNHALRPDEAADTNPVPHPEPLPIIQPQAMHNSEYVVTGRTAIGELPQDTHLKKQRGQRGKDKREPGKRRAPRSCARCKVLSPETMYDCRGKGSRKFCDYWDENDLEMATNE